MNAEKWDKDIKKSIKHRTVADIVEEYYLKKEEENNVR